MTGTILSSQEIKLIQIWSVAYKDFLESQAWWYKPVIPALGRLRQED
jgi:hypothetical protein